MTKLSPTFIDTNILIYCAHMKNIDVFAWINELYEKVYVHIDVLAEVKQNATTVEQKINELHWILFDPTSEHSLDELQYTAYEYFFEKVSIDFANYQNSRAFKQTVDTGDISILTSCLTLGINLITSNDTDFQQIIPLNNYRISSSIENEPDKLIEVHGLFELGKLLIEKSICKKRDYFKFLSAIHIKDAQLNAIKNELNKLFS